MSFDARAVVPQLDARQAARAEGHDAVEVLEVAARHQRVADRGERLPVLEVRVEARGAHERRPRLRAVREAAREVEERIARLRPLLHPLEGEPQVERGTRRRARASTVPPRRASGTRLTASCHRCSMSARSPAPRAPAPWSPPPASRCAAARRWRGRRERRRGHRRARRARRTPGEEAGGERRIPGSHPTGRVAEPPPCSGEWAAPAGC